MKHQHYVVQSCVIAVLAALTLPVGLSAAHAEGNAAVKSGEVNAKFARMDANNDGYISRHEAKDGTKDAREYLRAFNEADANGDGRLDSSEFIKAESLYQRRVAGHFVEDGVITAKVKTALIKEMKLNSTKVSVDTHDGQVLLSGFVDSEAQQRQALAVASSVNGVAGVKNGLVVK